MRDAQDVGRNGKEVQQTVELHFAKNVDDLLKLRNSSGSLSLQFRAIMSCREEVVMRIMYGRGSRGEKEPFGQEEEAFPFPILTYLFLILWTDFQPASPDSGPGTPVLRGVPIADGLMSRRGAQKQQEKKDKNEPGSSETEENSEGVQYAL